MPTSSDLPDLPEADIKALSLQSRSGLAVEPMFLARCLEEAQDKLFNLETHAFSMTFNGVQHVPGDKLLRTGDSAFFRIVQSQVISAPRPYMRTLLRCAVPGCMAECEFRGFALKDDLAVARNYPGVLLARPARKPDAEFLNGKSYVIAGLIQEHYHVIDAIVRKVPHTVKRKIENFVNSQPDGSVYQLDVDTLIDQSLVGFEPVKALLNRSALVSASGELMKKPRLDLGIDSSQSTAASTQLYPLADAEAVREVPSIGPGILEQPLADSTSNDNQSIEARLIQVGLIYVPEFCVFYCTMCKFYLRDTFAAHSQRVHEVKIPVNLLKEIKESHPTSDHPIPENDSLEAIDPLPHLPVKNGFVCSSCGFCLSDAKNMRAHIATKHGKSAAAPIACFVQCPFGGSANKLVQVKDIGVSTPDGGIISPLISEEAISAFFENRCRELEANPIEQPADDDNARNHLYQDLFWFKKSEVEYLLTTDFTSYFKGAFENENMINDIMIEILTSVRDADVSFRFGVNGHANGTFKNLKDTTIIKYAKTATKFISFVARMTLNPMSRYSMLPVENIPELIRHPTRALIMKIILECAFQNTAVNIGYDFLTTFLKLGCLKKDGSVTSAQSLAQRASDLIYIVKAAVLCEESEAKSKGVDSVYSKKLDQLHPNPTNHPNPFLTCTIILRKAKDIVKVTPSLPMIATTSNPAEFFCNGKLFKTSFFAKAFSLGMEKLTALIRDLTFGLEIDLSHVKDNLRLNVIDGSIASQNPTLKQLLIQAIMKTPTLSRKWFIQKGTDLILSGDISARYLKMHDDLIRWLPLVLHISSGLPCRFTEMETLRTQNSGHQPRNVFYTQETIMLLTTYSKTNNNKQTTQPCFRYLPRDLSVIVLKLLAVVRPFAALLAKRRGDPDEKLSHMFSLSQKPMSAENLREEFKLKFYQATSVIFTPQEYRHIVKHVCDTDEGLNNDSLQLMRSDIVLLQQNFSEFSGCQMNHSNQTSLSKYAQTTSCLQGVKSREQERMLEVSICWHNYLLRLINAERGSDGRNNCLVHSPTTDVGFSVKADVPPNIGVGVNPIVSGESGVDARRSILAESRMCLPRDDLYSENEVSDAFQDIVGVKELRKILRNDQATFNSTEQGQIVNFLLFKFDSAFIFQSPGMGKTLMMMITANYLSRCLPTQSHCSPRMVLILVPLIALKKQIIQKFLDSNIKVLNNFQEDGAAMVLVFDECVSMKPEILANHQRIGKIFVDEAHSLILDRNFRPILNQVHATINIGLPIILMTATGAPHIARELGKKFFPLNSIREFRKACILRNIKLSVVNYKNLSSVRHDIEEAEKRLQGEDRIIVYCRNINHLIEVGKHIKVACAIYHGKLTVAERDAAELSWISGEKTILLATSAYGLGMDYSAVRSVFIIGLPFTFEDYYQQSGRCSRDGQFGDSILCLLPESLSLIDDEIDNCTSRSVDSLVKYSKNETICRKRFCSIYFDGNDLSLSCSEIPNGNICDICRDIEHRIPKQKVSFKFVHDVETDNFTSEAMSRRLPPFSNGAPESVRDLMTPSQRANIAANCRRVEAISMADDHVKQALNWFFRQGKQGFCVACLGKNMFEPANHHCTLMKSMSRCLTCHGGLGDGHDTRNCPGKFPDVDKMCVRCWLPFSWGIGKHVSGCGRECTEYSLKKFLISHWQNAKSDDGDDFMGWVNRQISPVGKSSMFKNCHRTLLTCLSSYGMFNVRDEVNA